jgi:hypothetical protein
MYESGFCGKEESVAISLRVDKMMVAAFNEAVILEMTKIARNN